MKVEKELQKLIFDLSRHNHAVIELSGFTIEIDTYEEGKWASLTAIVYRGGDYIPPSVRRSLNEKPPFLRGAIHADLKLFEETRQIKLVYLGETSCIDCPEFFGLLEDFIWLAEKWQEYLDENDRNDLVYIHKNR